MRKLIFAQKLIVALLAVLCLSGAASIIILQTEHATCGTCG
jgi:hypothetical protein